MNNFARKATTLMTAAAAVMMAVAPAAVHAQAKTEISWFVGLGTGTDPQQITARRRSLMNSTPAILTSISASRFPRTSRRPSHCSVRKFPLVTVRTSSDRSVLVVRTVSPANTLILKPLIDKNKVDLSGYDPSLLSLYSTLNGGFSALPAYVYPSATYYNRDLFTEAGLAFPPAKYGDKYKMPDGTMVDWNYDTLAKIAKILTVDAAGNDATNAKFDPTKIVQYGFNFGWDGPRLQLTNLQPSAFYDAATNTVKISDDWRKAIQWYSDAIWKDHFIPNATASNSTLLAPPPGFDSMHLAMTVTPLWFTCCLTDTVGKLKWDLAAVPMSFDGKYHNAVDADTFRLYKGSKNPDAAFTVLQYLLNDATPELAPTYGAFPALAKYQQAFLDAKNKTYTQGVNWQAAVDGLKYTNPSNLHHESNSPNWQQGQSRWDSFWSLIASDNGAKVDLKAETDKLQTDLQAIVKGTFPTATPAPTAVPATAAATAAK